MRANLILVLATLSGCLPTYRHTPTPTGDDDATQPHVTAQNPRDPLPGCTDGSAPVYVLSSEQTLYLFDPSTMSFALIGAVDCPAAEGMVAESMSIDRYGTAWVHYSNDHLYNVNVLDGSCAPTSYQPLQHGAAIYDLAFTTDSAQSPTETLYASLESSKGLGSIDTKDLTLTVIGKSTDPLYDNSFALTGTDDARLFGLFDKQPSFVIAEIDKYSGRLVAMKELPTVYTTYTWAWAFWGGVFWIFTTNGDPTSDVTTYDPRTGEYATVMRNIGFNVVSAGVSTCAPIM